MAPSLIPTEFIGRRRLDLRLAAVVSDHHSLKEAPHIFDREPWREFVDGEGGEMRRRVLCLDVENSGLVGLIARVRTRLVSERHPGRAVYTATAARREDERGKQDRSKTPLWHPGRNLPHVGHLVNMRTNGDAAIRLCRPAG